MCSLNSQILGINNIKISLYIKLYYIYKRISYFPSLLKGKGPSPFGSVDYRFNKVVVILLIHVVIKLNLVYCPELEQ